MDLSSLEICQPGIRHLPNVNTVADLQTTSLAQEQLCDSPWLMFHRKLQGMTTETLLGPRAISLTHPVSKQARPKQLFPGPNPQPVLYSPFHNAFDATSHFYLLGVSSSSTALMNTIINWFSSCLSRCFFSASFFFAQIHFSVQLPHSSFLGFLLLLPTLPFRVSWRLTIICTSSEPLCQKAGSREAAAAAAITWPYGGLLLKRWNHTHMFRQDHCSGVLVRFLQTELQRNLFFLWVYSNQVSPFHPYSSTAVFSWHCQLFLSCRRILLELHTKPCTSLTAL